MRILHVVSGLRKAGGVSVFCGELCNELARDGQDVAVVIAETWRKDNYPLDQRVSLIGYDEFVEKSADVEFDAVHFHGLWELFLHRVATIAYRKGWRVIWSTHGYLLPWVMRVRWWKKWLGWFAYQKRDIDKASVIHVTAPMEESCIRNLGLRQDVVIAPLGVDAGKYRSITRVPRLDNKKEILFVSRVQRKKGIENLVRAWSILKKEVPEILRKWVIRIVGPDQENHTQEMKGLARQLQVLEWFEFCGPKFEEELVREYVNADVFILPTFAENFGSVVIESLAAGVPVITTKGAPWAELAENDCGWWVDIDPKAIAVALRDAMTMTDEERRAMGKRGVKLVEKNYTWASIAAKMVDAYRG